MKTKKNRNVLRMSILAVISLSLIYTIYMSLNNNTEDALSIGDPAPNFILKDMDGTAYELADYKGKGVFLNFWATYCEPCKEEMPYMNNVYKEYQDKGVEILAVNVGEAEIVVNKFSTTYSLDFPILYDSEEIVTNSYNFIPLPTSFLIDENGVIVDIISGALTEDVIRQYMDKVIPTS